MLLQQQGKKIVLWIVRHCTKLFFLLKSRDGKRADQQKYSWAHVHWQLFPVFPCREKHQQQKVNLLSSWQSSAQPYKAKLMQSCSAISALIQLPGMNQVCNLYKLLGFFSLFFPEWKSQKSLLIMLQMWWILNVLYQISTMYIRYKSICGNISKYFGVLICFLSGLR